METSKKLIENVSKMPAAAQQNPTTLANVDQAKGVVVADAQKRIDNISKLPPQARQNPKVQKDLAEAQQTVDAHGQKPGDQATTPQGAQTALAPAGPASSTHSSGGGLPPGNSATTQGTTPPSGHVTSSHTGTGGAEGSTGTHTTDGVAPDSGGQRSSTGTGIPHDATTTQEIDLARKITGNLDKVQAKRPLNPVEQQAYDKARGVLDRSGVPIVEHSRGRTNDAGYQNDRRATEAIVASNQKLANDAPTRSSAPSTHVRMNFHDSHSETMRQAMLLADHAHDASGMEPVKLTTTTAVGKDGKTTDGAYRHALRPYDAEIGVSRDSAFPIMTALHEFGHHVKTHLDPKDVAAIAEAARQTPEAKRILKHDIDPKYWLNDSELFSRAYAQWVVEHANHTDAKTAKEELQNILGSAQSHEQFSGPEWQKVKARINMAMQKRKWQ